MAAAPAPIQIATLLILYTLLDYWSHRLDHTRVFWPLHRFHHSAESFSVLTAARIHPAMFTAVITTTLPGVLLGSSRGALVDVGLVIAILRLVIHSRIESDFGWLGRWVVQSPLHHRLHHSFNRMPVNVGLTPIWDRLFGTWREAPEQLMKIGTVTPYRHGVWVGPDIWRDYCEFWVGLKKLALKQLPRLTAPATKPAG
jgi:sterol desaturase/sphingolipid hydroxylase (fatty acid hydroxylase superfamily)